MPQDRPDPVNTLINQAAEVVSLYTNVREVLPLPEGSKAEDAWSRVDKEVAALRQAVIAAAAHLDKEVG